jgi:hypothetical protein
MKFFASENLTTQSVSPSIPWEFKITERITAQIRGDKEDRQRWYQTPETKHNFYTGIEAINPNMRPTKENPPLRIHSFAADFDAKIPPERIKEAIAAMTVKPAWVERSLGGNARLIWLLPFPLLVDGYDFCSFVLQSAKNFLQLDLLPALDEKAFTTPSRLLCNGGDWTSTGFGTVPEHAIQAFFVDCGRRFRFRPVNEADIPLEIIEKALREKFPNMNWPGEFAVDAQGPTFWIPESTSPLSAIVKATGIFTFSAHAVKSFYSWADILGAEFVKNFQQTSIAAATKDIWWDSKRCWKLNNGVYVSCGEREITTYFKVSCKLSSKPDKSGASPLDTALNHIFMENRVRAAVPFVFRPPGLLIFQGERMLNTYVNRVIAPAAGKQVWGPQGKFPFLSKLIDSIFDPIEQREWFLAWFKYYFISAFEQVPLPGQNIFLMGGAGIGKTYLNREVIGAAVGGYIDASDYLLKGSDFNSHLMYIPHWCLDDDTPSGSPRAIENLHAMFKKTAANQQFVSNEKFQVAGMTEWSGRIGCTTNLDYVSSRVVGPMDNSSLDKTCLFRCVKESRFPFPARREMLHIARTELPYFLRYVVDMQVAANIPVDSRYGFAAYHEPTLLDQSHQSNPVAPFKELLIEALASYFKDHPAAIEWRGTVSSLIKMMAIASPMNDLIMKSIKMEQSSRYLEQVQKEGLLKCTTEVGPMKTRIWIFANPSPVIDVGATVAPLNTVTTFEKPTHEAA